MSQDVLFIAPIYQYYPILLHALISQQCKSWRLLLIHDGPPPEWLRDHVKHTSMRSGTAAEGAHPVVADSRIDFRWSDTRANEFGHNLREWGINIVKSEEQYKDIGYIVHTNADNYYAPGLVGTVLKRMIPNDSIMAVYFDCIHNYHKWLLLKSKLKFCKIDLGCVVYRASVAIKAGFPWRNHGGDWALIEHVIEKHGKDNIRKIPGVFLVHN